ncbi:MAG: HAMP domain-containing histidine kinase [Deltaproteobacteria bacterium]|nr:HAMP domain-containing histidine kinase [Deltaproteobacteria bacterium]
MAVALVLAASLTTTIVLHAAATDAVDRVLSERLLGAGESAVELLPRSMRDVEARLARLRDVNSLDAVYVVDDHDVVIGDAGGEVGRRINLLRVDRSRLDVARGGVASVGQSYSLGRVDFFSAYFPMMRASGGVPDVLVLEAGERFVAPRRALFPPLMLGTGLSVAMSLLLAVALVRAHRAEKARAQSDALALRAEALAQMSATAAHEIRNPLGVIRGTVELMGERSARSLTVRDKEALHEVLGEVDRLFKLTEDFLELAGHRPLALAPIDLAQVIDEAANAIAVAFSNVHVERRIDGMLVLSADGRRLRQVFENLLTNAAQAQGGEGTVVVEGGHRGGLVVVRVRDSGHGMDEATRQRLFEPYFTTKSSGTGLGLALSRRFVERHGGALDLVASARGQGTTFEVRLPTRPPVALSAVREDSK